MTRYEQKLIEIGKARNTSKFSAKVRGVKWNTRQLLTMKKIAALSEAPSLLIIKEYYPKMGEYKLSLMLAKVKDFRKEMAEIVGYVDPIAGVHDSKKLGKIYLIEHELYSGWIKCGMTINMKTRLGAYNVNDPLKRFSLIIERTVNDRKRCEAILKHNLNIAASLSNGEWYRIDKDTALTIFNAIP